MRFSLAIWIHLQWLNYDLRIRWDEQLFITILVNFTQKLLTNRLHRKYLSTLLIPQFICLCSHQTNEYYTDYSFN